MFRGCMKRISGVMLPILLFSFAGICMAADPAATVKQASSLDDQVRHELLMLPYFGVFDSLHFAIEGSDTVVLTGQVVRPILKLDAEAAVKRIPGVSRVVNNIEVLPLSRFDNEIRWRAYRAIYSRPGFERYAIQAVPPIKIIVKNGDLTLEGVVGSQLDKIMAGMAARSIPGVFSVTDDLRIG